MRKVIVILIVFLALMVLSSLIISNITTSENTINIGILVSGSIFGMISVFLMTSYYSIKKMIDELKNDENSGKTDPLFRSILLSIIMVIYAFIFIGSSDTSTIHILQILSGTIRLVAIFMGVYLLYINLYFTLIYIRSSRVFLKVLTVSSNILATLFFLLISYETIVEFL